ncbi:5-hydroxytryptamine receptor 3C-like [Ambystoma mexicanum]|uniref:5-hydroxytryptamine receptor 3C-like n=1 Tax=Ambystoma mexicanum TaxID=8296 RepID=UPI0037E76E94
MEELGKHLQELGESEEVVNSNAEMKKHLEVAHSASHAHIITLSIILTAAVTPNLPPDSPVPPGHYKSRQRRKSNSGFGPMVDSGLACTGSQSGPSYESLQEVFSRKSFRPTLNYSRPTSANISFTIYAILGVNEKTQILTTFLWLRLYWYHEFLTWDPAECGGVQKISLPVEDLWTPDIIVYEFIDEDKSQRTPYVYVNHTGAIRYDRMLRVVSSCNLGIFNFPFDVQNCSLTFGSYMHTVKDVRLGLALTIEQISENSKQFLETSGEWELVRIEGYPDILKFGIDEWDIVTFWVIVKRRPLLYVVNLLIPSAFLMVIDIMSFYLPPHSVDRASFKMTLLLGYTVFLLIMNDLLPSTTNGTPLIGIYFSVCLALLVLSLMETVIITHVLHRGAVHGTRIPPWLRRMLVEVIARLVCYKAPPLPNEKTVTAVIVPAKQNNLGEEPQLPQTSGVAAHIMGWVLTLTRGMVTNGCTAGQALAETWK